MIFWTLNFTEVSKVLLLDSFCQQLKASWFYLNLSSNQYLCASVCVCILHPHQVPVLVHSFPAVLEVVAAEWWQCDRVSVCSQDCHGVYIWNLKQSSQSLLRFMNCLSRPVKFLMANMCVLPCERSRDCLLFFFLLHHMPLKNWVNADFKVIF